VKIIVPVADTESGASVWKVEDEMPPMVIDDTPVEVTYPTVFVH
jgi:hypothetical protein